MKIVVTGGAGFIGSHLVHHLLAGGRNEVLVWDKLTYAGRRASLPPDGTPGFQFVRADIGDSPRLQMALAEFRPDGILHLAAESHVDRSIDGPEAFIQTNIAGTFRLLEAARAHYRGLSGGERDRFRLVHVSSDEVFGSLAPEDAPFHEGSRYDPRSPYSASKAAADHLVSAWRHTYGLPTLITNSTNNYGPRQFPEKLIPTVILKALAGQPIPVYGDGRNVRDWMYVEDHARGLELALQSGRVGQAYAFGGGSEWANLDLVRKICRILDELQPAAGGRPYEQGIALVADRPAHDFRYALDTGKAARELGWQPRETLDSGLRKTVAWYLDNRPWWQEILSGGFEMPRLGLAGETP